MNEIIINSEGNIKIDLTLNPTEITQDGTPTPDSPVDVNVIKGNNTITISNSDNTKRKNYLINLGNLEYGKIENDEDEIYKENNKWYLKKKIIKYILDNPIIWIINGSSATPNEISSHGSFTLPLNLNNITSLANKKMFTTKFKYEYNSNINNNPRANSMTNNTFCIRQGTNDRIYFRSTDFIGLSENEIKQIIGKLIIYCIPNNPDIIEITDTTLIEQLENITNNPRTYDNETIINQINDGLPFDISYKLDKNIVSVISDINEFLRVNL